MLIKPQKDTFQKLIGLNEALGSSEGGDQGILNNGLCPNWFYSGPEDPHCGRLPWIFNVEVAHYQDYYTFRKMQGQRLPAVLHFVGDGKPWHVLAYEYHPWEKSRAYISQDMMIKLGQQAAPHMMWRKAYFSALEGVEGAPPNPGNDVLARAVAAVHGRASSAAGEDHDDQEGQRGKNGLGEEIGLHSVNEGVVGDNTPGAESKASKRGPHLQVHGEARWQEDSDCFHSSPGKVKVRRKR